MSRIYSMKAARIASASVAALLVASLPAQAEQFGALPGRTMNAQENQGTAVEAFYKTASNGTAPGIRLSHRYSDDILLYADAVQMAIEVDEDGVALGSDLEGNAFGAGLMYFKPDLIDGYDAVISLSYHVGDLSTGATRFTVSNTGADGVTFTSEITEIAGQVIISSREPIADNGLQWYAGVGVHSIKSDDDLKLGNLDVVISGPGGEANLSQAIRDETGGVEFGATAGVVLPTSFGQVYAGVESIDGGFVGAGARYFLK